MEKGRDLLEKGRDLLEKGRDLLEKGRDLLRKPVNATMFRFSQNRLENLHGKFAKDNVISDANPGKIDFINL